MEKKGSQAVAFPDSLGLGTAAPIADTHLLSSMGLGPFSASWFCWEETHEVVIQFPVSITQRWGEPSSFREPSVSPNLKEKPGLGLPHPSPQEGCTALGTKLPEARGRIRSRSSPLRRRKGEHTVGQRAKGEEAQT